MSQYPKTTKDFNEILAHFTCNYEFLVTGVREIFEYDSDGQKTKNILGSFLAVSAEEIDYTFSVKMIGLMSDEAVKLISHKIEFDDLTAKAYKNDSGYIQLSFRATKYKVN